MAGDWIKMRDNLWDDPRIARLCDLTGESEAAVIGGLYWLWSTADQHTEDGVMPGLSTNGIDRKTGIKGLGSGLVAIGWIVDHPECIRIVNFEEHNGSSAKKRAVTAKRVANHRSCKAGVTQEALQNEDKSVTGALAREREREREDKEPPKPPADKSADSPREQKPEPPGFAKFWETWPANDRKQAKGKCLDAWKKAHAERDAALVIEHVLFLKNGSWARDGGQFVPSPLVYLNQRRWDGAQVFDIRPNGVLAGAI